LLLCDVVRRIKSIAKGDIRPQDSTRTLLVQSYFSYLVTSVTVLRTELYVVGCCVRVAFVWVPTLFCARFQYSIILYKPLVLVCTRWLFCPTKRELSCFGIKLRTRRALNLISSSESS
jgi:hypothetical protein